MAIPKAGEKSVGMARQWWGPGKVDNCRVTVNCTLARARPDVPSTLGALARQRDRWQRGLADTMIRHQRMLLNPRYGSAGLPAYPFFYFLETFGYRQLNAWWRIKGLWSYLRNNDDWGVMERTGVGPADE